MDNTVTRDSPPGRVVARKAIFYERQSSRNSIEMSAIEVKTKETKTTVNPNKSRTASTKIHKAQTNVVTVDVVASSNSV